MCSPHGIIMMFRRTFFCFLSTIYVPVPLSKHLCTFIVCVHKREDRNTAALNELHQLAVLYSCSTQKWQKAAMNSLLFPQKAAVSHEPRRMLSHSGMLNGSQTNVTIVTQQADEFTPTQNTLNSFSCLSLCQAPTGRWDLKRRLLLCEYVCIHYQGNPSPLWSECFSKVYSTASEAEQRKDSILLPLLPYGKMAALPEALVSVVLLSRATDWGHKMGLEGTQHRTLTFLSKL